ncbi:hypothetical protein TNCV_1813651 [Trichonephila clavipes]|uniref:Uncharacterized protein n=1 Tax=Trichonephila clavipes TaxID=2585209 RepID=A0A8X6W7P4_TRICX|nr:hypothetical protein TNCV_1813651 [Trichonephila clavipes]
MQQPVHACTSLLSTGHRQFHFNGRAIVRNRCLHLATGRTRDDIERRIWQRQRRKGRNGGGEGGEETGGREK